ncbi:MAG TPA: hypothetical protein DEQ09_02385 [Bacteroidales bacterium]|nr:hypothetical protein [Bacteroidales bacterium]
MVKYDSHIDVLFRDRLCDMEVLPPESVWENIKPVLNNRRNKGLFFKIAAGIAVLTSLGLMAYFYSGMVFDKTGNQPLSATGNSLTALFDASYININVVSEKDIQLNGPLPNTMATDSRTEPDNVSNIMPDQIINHNDVNLVFEEPENSILRDNNTPDEVSGRGNPSVILISEILPVEPINETKKDKKWQLGAIVSPTYLSSNLKTANEVLSQINDNEGGVLSYTGGISVSYKMSNRLSIQTGLYYSSLGREIKGVTSYSGFSPYASSKGGVIFGVETSSGTVNSTNNDIFLSDVSANRIDGYYSVDNFDPVKFNLTPYGDQLRQSFEYLEIPLMVRYKFIDSKLDFNILGGMSYNFLIGNQTWAMNNKGSKVLIGSTEGVDHLLLSSSLGMSMEYEISENFSLNFEPHVRYFLNTGGDLGSGNPYTFGIFSGMHFKF